MNLDKNELDLIEAWARMAQPLSGVYYRSVEYRYIDPKTVLDGNGAATHGGRFASVGTKAVYLAESDSVASGGSDCPQGTPGRERPDLTRQVPADCLQRGGHLEEGCRPVKEAPAKGQPFETNA